MGRHIGRLLGPVASVLSHTGLLSCVQRSENVSHSNLELWQSVGYGFLQCNSDSELKEGFGSLPMGRAGYAAEAKRFYIRQTKFASNPSNFHVSATRPRTPPAVWAYMPVNHPPPAKASLCIFLTLRSSSSTSPWGAPCSLNCSTNAS
jgi:hypothetical protein